MSIAGILGIRQRMFMFVYLRIITRTQISNFNTIFNHNDFLDYKLTIFLLEMNTILLSNSEEYHLYNNGI